MLRRGFGSSKAFAASHDFFGIGVFQCVLLELGVRESCLLRHRTRGEYSVWCFNPKDVYIVGVWFAVNVGNEVGCHHVDTWRPELESHTSRSDGCSVPCAAS